MTSSQAKSPRLSPRLRRPTTRAPSWTLGFLTAVFFSLAALSPSIATNDGPRPSVCVALSNGRRLDRDTGSGRAFVLLCVRDKHAADNVFRRVADGPKSKPGQSERCRVFPNIFMVGNYKVVLTDFLGNQLWTADPVSGANVIHNPMLSAAMP